MVDIRHQIPISATPDKVYAAVATQAGLRGWWTADSKADVTVGGNAELGFERRAVVFRMRIETLEPGRLVAWSCHGDQPEWNGTTLTWTITPQNGSTVLRFTHGGWRALTDYCVMCNTTWGELMYRLKDFVEGRNPGPHWKE